MSTSVLADRREEAALAALRRGFHQGFTTLHLARRQWAKMSTAGKAALASCANAESMLLHAETPVEESAQPCDCAAVRRNVTRIATRRREAAQAEVDAAMAGLEAAVASMRGARGKLDERLAQAAEVIGAERAASAPVIYSETASQLLAHADAFVVGFAQELELRVEMATEIRGGEAVPERADRWPEIQRTYFAAWMVEPHIDNQRLDLLLNAIDPEAVPPPQGKRR